MSKSSALKTIWNSTSLTPRRAVARFRVNAFRDRGNVAAAMRVIPTKIPTAEDLNLPPLIMDMANRPRGLMLVTGPTGSGKSTTLAAVINKINSTHDEHIITIEDPIEFVHRHKRCVVNQREVGTDTKAFQQRLARRFARRPGCDSGRRNARQRDDSPGDYGGRNRSPCFRHSCTPTRRRNPSTVWSAFFRRPAGTDSHAAFELAGRDCFAAAFAARQAAGAWPRSKS